MAALVLDHVFCCSAPGAPEAAPLWAAGLRPGRSRAHPGQGTANTCVFFADAMLELLWITDEAAARSALVAPTGLWARSRWRQTGASPFGVCLRAARDEPAALPFPTEPYRPPYLPDGVSIRLARGLPAAAPLVFVITAPWQPPDVAHALSGAAVTRCTVRSPAAAAVQAAWSGPRPARVTFEPADRHELLLELSGDAEHDGAGSGVGSGGCDLRPRLPLALRWSGATLPP